MRICFCFKCFLIIPAILTGWLQPCFSSWQLHQITDNTVNDRILRIAPHGGNLAWMDQDNSVLYFWDGSSIHPIESGAFGGFTVDHSTVIYSHWGITGNYDLYQWENGISSQLTTYTLSDSYPVMFNNWYAWLRDYDVSGNTSWEIMLFDDVTEQRITNNSDSDQGIAIGDGNIFWLNTGDQRVYRYDGSSTYSVSGIGDYVSDSIVQDAWNNHAVWLALYGSPGDDREVVYYDGSITHRLTDNSVDDFYPRIHGSRVVWQGRGGSDAGTDYEIFLYDNGILNQLTVNDVDDEYPDVSETLVAWRQVVTTSPYDLAAMVYDGVSTTRITPPEYAVTNIYLHEQTVLLILDDGNDDEIFTATWEPDPTVTPTQTPTTPPPPVPSTSQWSILILGGILGMILIVSTSSRQLKLFLFFLLFEITTSSGATLAQSINWDVECADCPPLFLHMEPDALQENGDGYPLVSCGFDHLYTCTHNGSSWIMETIDPEPAVGLFASLAIDSLNQAHISYFDDKNNHLKYARQTGGAWSIVTLDTLSGTGYCTSLELDSFENPHIAYGDNQSGNQGLYYTFFDGANWQYETIQNSFVPFSISLVLDSNGEPCITYHDQYDRKLKYASRSGGLWTIETVIDQAQCGEGSVLIMDNNGNPHILYVCDVLKHSWNTGTGWQHESLTSVWAGSISLRFDNPGILHATWIAENSLYYATWDGSTWDIETAQTAVGNEQFWWSSLILDGSGIPAIAYYENQSNQLRFCAKQGSTWTSELIAAGANVGGAGSASLNSTDDCFISYIDRSRNRLRFAWQDSGNWQNAELDPGSLVFYTSSAVDSNSYAHITYHDASTSSLKYATNESGDWVYSTIESDAGSYCRFALGVSNTLHAVFYSNLSILRYAVNNGSGWIAENISDLPGSFGYTLGLTIDNSGYPHVSFFNIDASTLGYAYKDVSGWHVDPTVDPNGTTGKFSSIALDSNGFPRIIYCETLYNHELRHAAWNGTGWDIQTIYSHPGWPGTYTSLVIDSTDYSHVVYSGSPGIFFYMYQSEAGWHVSEGLRCGSEPITLMLDSNEKPVVAFFDDLTWDMKVSRYSSGTSPTTTPTSGATPTSTATATPSPTSSPTSTPTPSPTGSGTITPPPTATPTWTPTIHPTVTPTQPTATPTDPTDTPTPPDECTTTGVTIDMPSQMFEAGDTCWCRALVCNAGAEPLNGYPLFVILDVYGQLYWAPSFNSVFDNYLMLYPEFTVGVTTVQVLPEFSWPTNTGSVSGILWYGALTNPQITDIYGDFSVFSFGWDS
ncbi:hypothetical protein JW823_01625 [bacterium]|nr:hypothetical protein [candidate division CSSED10-310 bacterium]